MTRDGDTTGIGIRKTMPATLSLALLSGEVRLQARALKHNSIRRAKDICKLLDRAKDDGRGHR